ncbi:MAG: hypothetical protein GY792_29565 [Gammaproteobacteria bacterium]|nr:hypothetical protein [Gammaproteobacteria bacterium]
MGERRLAEAEAVFLQFQEQLQDIIQTTTNQSELISIKAINHFHYLPSVGLLPISRGSAQGISIDNFFSEQPHRQPEFIDGNLFHVMLRQAANYEPIDLSQGEMVWLYKPWQNDRAVSEGEVVQPYIIFTSGHIPYAATARFDMARWDYSHYA